MSPTTIPEIHNDPADPWFLLIILLIVGWFIWRQIFHYRLKNNLNTQAKLTIKKLKKELRDG